MMLRVAPVGTGGCNTQEHGVHGRHRVYGGHVLVPIAWMRETRTTNLLA